jgi:hypothetical protein
MKLSWIWKGALCVVIYIVASALSGMVVAALGLRLPASMIEGTPAQLFLRALWATPILVVGLAPLAARLGGSWAARFAALSMLTYLSLSLNSVLETRVFTSMLKTGGSAFLLAHGVLPALAVCAALALWFGGAAGPPPIPRYGLAGWTWRIAVAVLAFPVAYFTFGMMVAPIVVPYYTGGGSIGLAVPPVALILRTVFVRSSIFLVASLPAVLLWIGSRRGLIGALGWAHAVLVGIFGLAQTHLLPPILRITHSIEITADSFAYAAVLAWLFVARSRAAAGSGRKTQAVS